MSFHSYPQWRSVPPEAWPSKYFTVQEFAQRGPGWHEGLTPVAWDDAFLGALDRLREAVGQPLLLTSGYRSPSYNSSVSHTGEAGPHTTGKAADISCDGRLAFKIIREAMRLGFSGFGIAQKGDQRFIHIDMVTDGPRPNVWTY